MAPNKAHAFVHLVERLCWVERLGQYTEIECPEGIYIEWDLTDDTPVYSDQVNIVDVNFYWDEGFPVLESGGDLVQHMNLHSCRMVECSPAYPTIGVRFALLFSIL